MQISIRSRSPFKDIGGIKRRIAAKTSQNIKTISDFRQFLERFRNKCKFQKGGNWRTQWRIYEFHRMGHAADCTWYRSASRRSKGIRNPLRAKRRVTQMTTRFPPVYRLVVITGLNHFLPIAPTDATVSYRRYKENGDRERPTEDSASPKTESARENNSKQKVIISEHPKSPSTDHDCEKATVAPAGTGPKVPTVFAPRRPRGPTVATRPCSLSGGAAILRAIPRRISRRSDISRRRGSARRRIDRAARGSL